VASNLSLSLSQLPNDEPWNSEKKIIPQTITHCAMQIKHKQSRKIK
jgi:hypothetical protein